MSKIIVKPWWHSLLLLLVGCWLSVPAWAQNKKNAKPNQVQLVSTSGYTVFNRTISPLNAEGHQGIRLDAKPGDGIAWLNNTAFKRGTIEFDVRGKDVFQQSFVGIAFQGKNDSTFEAIYFRPFNFKAEDPDRRSHAVQYISQPEYTWQRLRKEHPGQYEQPLNPTPDPTQWFHVRVVVESPKVTVFVNEAAEPSLTVEQLRTPVGEKIGFWVGNNSEGDFANLSITSKK